jgi:hypothetical protein
MVNFTRKPILVTKNRIHNEKESSSGGLPKGIMLSRGLEILIIILATLALILLIFL